MCNCSQCLSHVDCTCPETTGVSSAVAVAYINTTYTPAQSISGAGFNVVLYTNTSSDTETVLVETNMYLIGSEPASVTTTTYAVDAATISGAGTALKEVTPLKTDHTHFLGATTLAAGENINITIAGSLGSPTIKWIKSVVYKY